MPDLTDLIVPARFCGPPSSGNGGWTAGALALRALEVCPDHDAPGGAGGPAPARPTVTVSLLAPPPLDVPIQVTATDDGGVRATYAGRPVLSARCSHDTVADVDPVPAGEARAAEASFAGLTSHPFPGCFVCGPDRAEGDGLRIFPGRVADATGEPGTEVRARVAATWTPAGAPGETLADPVPRDDVRRASVPATWAALDCVGGWGGDLEDRLMVLGRMTARLDSLPVVGEEHVVIGTGHRREGRKTWTSASLYDAAGRVVGSAEHLWIAVDPAAFA